MTLRDIIDRFELKAGRLVAPNKQLVGYTITADEWREMRSALLAAHTQTTQDVVTVLNHMTKTWESMAGPPNSVYEQCARDVRQISTALQAGLHV